MRNKSSLTFSFCGDREVNAMALSEAISSLVEISSVIAEREYPDVQFRMSVSAVTPGSLQFDFIASVIGAAQNILTPGNIEYAENMISTITNVFSIKGFLKGKPPKEKRISNDKIIIKNQEGGEIEIPQNAGGVYFIDNRVDASLSKLVRTANASAGTTGIAIKAKQYVEIPREDFEDCSVPISVSEETSKTIVTIRNKETLFIRQADFSGDLKWRFKSDQNITAKILDEDFLKNVSDGNISLNSKSYIIADVRVTVYLEENGTLSEAKPMYEVIKVYETHTSDENQTMLNL